VHLVTAKEGLLGILPSVLGVSNGNGDLGLRWRNILWRYKFLDEYVKIIADPYYCL